MNKGINVWTIKDSYRLGSDIQSKVLAFAFGLSAEIERNLISMRTKEALALKRSNGCVLGRPKGSITAPQKRKLYGKEHQIDVLLKAGIPKIRIAEKCDVSINTLNRYLKEKQNCTFSVSGN